MRWYLNCYFVIYTTCSKLVHCTCIRNLKESLELPSPGGLFKILFLHLHVETYRFSGHECEPQPRSMILILKVILMG